MHPLSIENSILLVIGLSLNVWASGVGECPQNYAMKNFNSSKFLGQWFEVERSFYLLEIVASCTSLNISVNDRGHLNVTASTINRWTDQRVHSYGTAYSLLLPTSAVFRYRINTKLPHPVARFLPGAGIYHVLHTDYDNYAILWWCSNFFVTYTDRIWVFGRKKHIKEKLRIEIYERLRYKYGLDPERLMISKNENCTMPLQ